MTGQSRRWLMLGALGIASCMAGVGGVVLLAPDPAAAAQVLPAAVDLSALDRVPPQTWASLKQKRILFGHQSVGKDIVAGIVEIMRIKPQIQLRISGSHDAAEFDTPGLVHTHIGVNGDPKSKLTEFGLLVTGPLGERADIAFMKFCYADIVSGVVPEAVFEEYQQAMTSLASARPDVRFLHLTMPLRTVQTGPKARVKRLAATTPGGYTDNILRNQYNRLLTSRYDGSGSVFDLANAEARLPDGRVASFTAQGESWLCLSTGFSRDSGHLNEAGKLAAARDLLLVLAEQCR